MNHSAVRDFYDRVCHRWTQADSEIPGHYQRLAKRFSPWSGKRLLDVGCGTGVWLRAANDLGAIRAGIDISQVALSVCRGRLPQAELHCGPAENLPFPDHQFNFVSCLGALEHFLDPHGALCEMVRVAKDGAVFLLLVPNAGFLPRRLGLYSGTEQLCLHEEVRTLHEWQELFESAGLQMVDCWKDLHVLSRPWVTQGRWYLWPVRAAQALALPLWPLSWQYQVYHHCILKK